MDVKSLNHRASRLASSGRTCPLLHPEYIVPFPPTPEQTNSTHNSQRPPSQRSTGKFSHQPFSQMEKAPSERNGRTLTNQRNHNRSNKKKASPAPTTAGSFHISTLHPPLPPPPPPAVLPLPRGLGQGRKTPRPFSQCSIPILILKPPPDPKLTPSRTHTHTHTHIAQNHRDTQPFPLSLSVACARWHSQILDIFPSEDRRNKLAHSPTAPKGGYTGEAGRVPTKGNQQSGFFSLCNHPAGVARGGGGGATFWRCCSVSFWVVVFQSIFFSSARHQICPQRGGCPGNLTSHPMVGGG